MDTNNWRPTAQGGEPVMDAHDWRAQLQPGARHRIVIKLMETLKRHLPFSGQEGLQELKKIAVCSEEKIYTAATSLPDYLRKLSLKMVTMENMSQNTISDYLPENSSGNSNKLPDPAAHNMQSQVRNQGQSLSIPLYGNQSQAHLDLSFQNAQNYTASAGVQTSASQACAFPSVSGFTQIPMASISQNSNKEDMSNMTQDSVRNSMGQVVPSNVISNAHGQTPERQLIVLQLGQQKSQNSQRLYQLQHHLMDQQNNLATLPQQQLIHKKDLLLQQQQLLSSQSRNPSLPDNLHAVQMLQHTGPMQQQSKQSGTDFLATPGQQSQSKQPQQQLMSPMQLPPTQLQRQLSLQQQCSPVQGDLQQRLQVSGQGTGCLLQSQSVGDQQRQSHQSQQSLLDSSNLAAQTGQANESDWQEEVYQKVKQMKETFLPALSEMYQRITAKIQQHDSLPPPQKPELLEKLKIFRSMVERMMSVIQITRSDITPGFKEKLPSFEKQILSFLNSYRPREPVSSEQQAVSQRHMQSTQLQTSELLPPKEPAFNCPICMGPFIEETTTRCGHIFCKKCITSALAVRKECPACRRRVVAKDLIRVFLPTTD